MNRPDHSTFQEWLNLDADGRLAPEERARLEQHLAGCEECREEREELAAFQSLFERTTVPVRSDFADSVMAALPHTGWEGKSPRTWQFPVAVAAMLMLAAGFLIAGSSAASVPSGLAALDALASMVSASVLAGAGLLGASWKGIGLIVEDIISSPVSLGAFAFLVLCLNLLLISLVRRRKPSAATAASSPGGRGGREPNGGR
ncbi:MAG TPA: zf-HC2 domain-containing protein [Thermoanaerobaculia bacterium]|jgi:anti-sigma factor RsiW|nr:zf-HC2 domain-containing protein [Thermoanaerobaculia bacterium]